MVLLFLHLQLLYEQSNTRIKHMVLTFACLSTRFTPRGKFASHALEYWLLGPIQYMYILITTQQAHQASDDQGDAEVNSKDDIVHKLHAGYNQEALLQVECQLNLSLHTREQAIR